MLLDLLPLLQPQVTPPAPVLTGPAWTPIRQPRVIRQRGSLRYHLTITGRAKVTSRASVTAHLTRTATATLRSRAAHTLTASRAGHAQMRARVRLDLDLTTRATPAPIRMRSSAHLTAASASLRAVGIRHNPLPWPIHELLFESWDQ